MEVLKTSGTHKVTPESLRIGQNIANLRKRQKWTQKQLAEVCGTTTTYISALERGEGKPGPEIMPRLCEAFGVEESRIRFGEREVGTAIMGNSVWDQMATAAWQKLPEAAKKKLLPLILAEVPEGQEGLTTLPPNGGRKENEEH